MGNGCLAVPAWNIDAANIIKFPYRKLKSVSLSQQVCFRRVPLHVKPFLLQFQWGCLVRLAVYKTINENRSSI